MQIQAFSIIAVFLLNAICTFSYAGADVLLCQDIEFLELTWHSEYRLWSNPKPCIYNDTLIGASEESKSRLLCIDTENGSLRWSNIISEDLEWNTRIVVKDDVICIPLSKSIAFIDAHSGNSIKELKTTQSIVSVCWTEQGIVLLNSNNSIRCLSWPALKTKWHSICEVAEPLKLEFVEETLLVCGKREIQALNYKTGDTLWNRELGSPSSCPVAGASSRLFFGTRKGVFFCLNASSGQVIWKHDVRWHESIESRYSEGWYPVDERGFSITAKPLIHNDKIVLFSNSHPKHKAVTVLSLNSGNVEEHSGKAELFADWVTVDNYIFFVSPEGFDTRFHLVSLSSLRQVYDKKIIKRERPERILSTDGDVVIVSSSGDVYRFDFRSDRVSASIKKLSLLPSIYQWSIANMSGIIYTLLSLATAIFFVWRLKRRSRSPLSNQEVQMKISVTIFMMLIVLLLSVFVAQFYLQKFATNGKIELLWVGLFYLFPILSLIFILLIYPPFVLKSFVNLDTNELIKGQSHIWKELSAFFSQCAEKMDINPTPTVLIDERVDERGKSPKVMEYLKTKYLIIPIDFIHRLDSACQGKPECTIKLGKWVICHELAHLHSHDNLYMQASNGYLFCLLIWWFLLAGVTMLSYLVYPDSTLASISRCFFLPVSLVVSIYYLICTSVSRDRERSADVALQKFFPEIDLTCLIAQENSPIERFLYNITATSKCSPKTAIYSTLIAGSTSINSYDTLFSSSFSDRKAFSYMDQLLRNHPAEHSRVSYLRDHRLITGSKIFPSIREMLVIGAVLGFAFYAYNAARIVEVLGSELLNFGSMSITGIAQKVYYGEINQTLTSIPLLLRKLSFLFLSISFATFFVYNFNHPDVKKPIPLNYIVIFAAKIFVALFVAHIIFSVLISNVDGLAWKLFGLSGPVVIRPSPLYNYTLIFIAGFMYSGTLRKTTGVSTTKNTACVQHLSVDAISTCEVCRRNFCESCLTRIKGNIVCCHCVNELVFQNNASPPTELQRGLLNNILIRRTLAFILDLLLIVAILKALGWVYSFILLYFIMFLGEGDQIIPSINIGNIIIIGATIVFSLREFLFGAKGHRQSLGKRLLGIEVVEHKSGGQSPRWGHIIRNLPNFLICFGANLQLFLFLYYIIEYMFIYLKGRRLIDYITGTRVQRVGTGAF